MTDLIDKDYTDDQIERAKQLFDTFVFKTRYRNGRNFYITRWGDKTEAGLINTILNIMFGGGR